MKLIEINKTHYRSTLNKVIVGFVIAFALLSVGFGTILIHFFGEVAVGDEPVNNFRFNLLGVILGLIVCTLVMNNIKNKPQMSEVYYVWQLKQLQNQIFRRLTKIKAAAKINFTGHLELTTHQLNDFLAYRQPQPRSSVLSGCAAIGLLKLVKD